MMKKLALMVLALLLTVSAVSAGTVMITPSEPDTTDDLTGYVSGVDSDVEFDYYWMKDGQVYETCSDTTCTLDASYTEAGDVWTVHAFVPESAWVDTYEYGFASVTIRESEEDTPSAIPIGTSEIEGTDIHFTVTEGDLIDVDLEEVNYFQFQMYEILTGLSESTVVYAYDADDDALKIDYFGYLDGEGRWQTEVGDAGYYFTTARIYDGHGNSEQVGIYFTILEAETNENTCPEITANDITVEEGDLAVADYTAYDAEGDSLIISFSSPFNSVGQWQTTEGDEGVYTASVTASDGECSASDEFIVTVTCLDANDNGVCDSDEEVDDENTCPLVGAEDLTVEEGDLASVLYQAYDADGDALTVTFSSPFDSNGEWQTAEGDEGVYTASVTASDGECSASDEFTVTVTCLDANDNGVCDSDEDDDDNDDEKCEDAGSNYEGSSLEVVNVQVLNADSLYSAYDVSDLNLKTSGVFYVEDGYLRSSASDDFIEVLVTIENGNSFDADDINVMFVLDDKNYKATFSDLERSEKGSQTYKISVPENLESGSYSLKVYIENSDISYETAINVNIDSLGDYIVDGSAKTHMSLWDWLKSLFNKLF